MKKKLYAQASKTNTKRFCEAEIQDQLTEIENILNVFHEECCNLSHVLPAVCIDEDNNVQANDLIVEGMKISFY